MEQEADQFFDFSQSEHRPIEPTDISVALDGGQVKVAECESSSMRDDIANEAEQEQDQWPLPDLQRGDHGFCPDTMRAFVMQGGASTQTRSCS